MEGRDLLDQVLSSDDDDDDMEVSVQPSAQESKVAASLLKRQRQIMSYPTAPKGTYKQPKIDHSGYIPTESAKERRSREAKEKKEQVDEQKIKRAHRKARVEVTQWIYSTQGDDMDERCRNILEAIITIAASEPPFQCFDTSLYNLKDLGAQWRFVAGRKASGWWEAPTRKVCANLLEQVPAWNFKQLNEHKEYSLIDRFLLAKSMQMFDASVMSSLNLDCETTTVQMDEEDASEHVVQPIAVVTVKDYSRLLWEIPQDRSSGGHSGNKCPPSLEEHTSRLVTDYNLPPNTGDVFEDAKWMGPKNRSNAERILRCLDENVIFPGRIQKLYDEHSAGSLSIQQVVQRANKLF